MVLFGVYEKRGEKIMVMFFYFFYKKKLVHIVGLCFGLSSFSQWISPLFIRVERRVRGAYLA